MVSEIILCVKERNKQTRATSFELLVQIAHAMHDAEPPPPGLDYAMADGEQLPLVCPHLVPTMTGLQAFRFPEWGGCRGHLCSSRSPCIPPSAQPPHQPCLALPSPLLADGSDSAAQRRGGLHTLFTMVLGGLVGATPHMISAAVMALARLLYEFAPVLTGLVPDLLPAVLMLLRTKAREVIKSVLGFIKVGGGMVLGHWSAIRHRHVPSQRCCHPSHGRSRQGGAHNTMHGLQHSAGLLTRRRVIYNLRHFTMLQVVSLRLPAEFVAQFLPQILEGILLWAEDSKNKFRAKVGREAACED